MNHHDHHAIGPQPDLQAIQAQTAARGLVCKSCGSTYYGAIGQPVCPLCETVHVERHLLKLQDRRFQLQQELADLSGQIESIVASIQQRVHVDSGPAESIRCGDCGGWLHLGWVQLVDNRTVCESCGIKRGVREGFQRSEWCHHGFPIRMCRPCRAVHRGLVRDAERKFAAANKLREPRAERVKPSPSRKLALEDMEEI